MLVVRNSFTAKPGQAGKLAAMLKDVAGAMLPNNRVLTDLTGEFNTVIMEFEVENLGEFEANLRKYATDPMVREKMVGYTDLWTSGSREIFQLVK